MGLLFCVFLVFWLRILCFSVMILVELFFVFLERVFILMNNKAYKDFIEGVLSRSDMDLSIVINGVSFRTISLRFLDDDVRELAKKTIRDLLMSEAMMRRRWHFRTMNREDFALHIDYIPYEQIIRVVQKDLDDKIVSTSLISLWMPNGRFVYCENIAKTRRVFSADVNTVLEFCDEEKEAILASLKR